MNRTAQITPLTRPTVACLVLISAVCFFFSLQVASFGAPMSEIDEAAQSSYAGVLAGGTLPTIDTLMPTDPGSFPGSYLVNRHSGDAAHADIWTANHPPLFYLTSVPAVWLSNWLNQPALGLAAMRVLNALCTAAMAFLAGLLARELVPHRPSVVLLAAAVAAAMSATTFLGGVAYNDGMGAAFGAWVMLLVARMLRVGVTRRRVVALSLVCAAAAATRASALPIVALAVVGVAVAGLLRDRSSGGWRRALVPAFVVGAVPALTVGWFYIRNIALYGDPTASTALLTKFARAARPELLSLHRAVPLVAQQWEWVFVEQRIGRASARPLNSLINAIGWLAVVGIVMGVVVGFVRWRAAGRRRPDVASVGVALAWSIVVVHVVATIGTMLNFVAAGGGTHERYMMPIAPMVSVLAAAGLVSLVCWWPRRARPMVEETVATLGCVVFLTLAVILQLALMRWFVSYQAKIPSRHSLLGMSATVVFGWLGRCAALAVVVLLGWQLFVRWRDSWRGLTVSAAGRDETVDLADSPGPELVSNEQLPEHI